VSTTSRKAQVSTLLGTLKRSLPSDSRLSLNKNFNLHLNLGKGSPKHTKDFTNPIVTTLHITVSEVRDIVGSEELLNHLQVPIRNEPGVGCQDLGCK